MKTIAKQTAVLAAIACLALPLHAMRRQLLWPVSDN